MGASFTLGMTGVDACLARFGELDKDLRRQANRDMRSVAKQIATDMLPLVRGIVAAGPAPQSARVATTARVKSDRVPVVTVGSVNPPLSGFRRSRGDRLAKGSVAYGVEFGTAGGHRAAGGADYYRMGRVAGGAALGRQRQVMQTSFTESYRHALADVMRQYGVI